MLGNADVAATIATKDLEKAKNFYTETLGLKIIDENPGGIMMQSGNSNLFIYPSEFAGTNKATTAGWTIDDVDGAAADLKGKGITLDHYDLPGVTLEGDVHIMGELKAIWFKDPDGNILSVSNMK